MYICTQANDSCVWYVWSGHFVVMCVARKQILQWDGLVECIVDEELGDELRYNACAPGGIICITGGYLDRCSKLRVGELVVSVLKFFILWQLFCCLRLYELSCLVCC